MECHHVVKRLENDGTVRQLETCSFCKRFVRYVIYSCKVLNMLDFVVLDIYMCYTITCTNPNIVVVVFYHSTYYLIGKPILVAILYSLCIRSHKTYSAIGSLPSPSSAIYKRASDCWRQIFCIGFNRFSHLGLVAFKKIGIGSVLLYRRRIWFAIE